MRNSMRAIAVLIAVALSACTASFGAEHHTLVKVSNIATATVAGAGMAMDWCGTRHAAETRTDDFEGGMPTMHVIGPSPSPGAVDAYFAIGTVVLWSAAQLVPERYRWIAYGVVAGVELTAVHSNLSTTRCGPVGVN